MITGKAPNACPSCGSVNDWHYIGEKKEGLNTGKAIAGGILLGGIGAVAGAASGKKVFSYHCNRCGFGETYSILGDFKKQSASEPNQTFGNKNFVVQGQPLIIVNQDNLKSTLARIDLFLEDGEWDRADAYCEQVLNFDPYNVDA